MHYENASVDKFCGAWLVIVNYWHFLHPTLLSSFLCLFLLVYHYAIYLYIIFLSSFGLWCVLGTLCFWYSCCTSTSFNFNVDPNLICAQRAPNHCSAPNIRIVVSSRHPETCCILSNFLLHFFLTTVRLLNCICIFYQLLYVVAPVYDDTRSRWLFQYQFI